MILGPCFEAGLLKKHFPFFQQPFRCVSNAFARDVNGIQQTFGILEKCKPEGLR